MTKTAVQIDLVWTEDESQAICIYAIQSNAKLASEKMHCHLIEWNGEENEIYPGLLIDEDGTHCKYSAEWGYNNQRIDFFYFLDQPLAVGQLVTRTQILSSTPESFTYRITSIMSLLT
ncbi:hypothetical protein [Pseudomonas sp. F01002]|uniref:hypothetical protein n=1 Tax=Pseudomonas sp. F01002 TaxID=2555724 RepID=UPI00106AC469|nr:hypothetical protein [Pseudomonas sp. F01002]TFB37871.1 hypothetical protein E3W21_19455 [Pseudomonas sp. F01002]